MRPLLHVAGAVAFAGWSLLAWQSRTEHAAILPCVLAIVALGWLSLGLAWWATKHTGQDEVIRAIWIWGILFRVAGFLGAPLLEDDWARYLWDGRQFFRTGNPYASTPMEHFSDPDVPREFQKVLDEINHPQLPTIYAPACELAFLVGHEIAPARLWPLKLMFIGADLLVLALLLRLVPPRQALLYAWCPLVVQEIAFTAHPDILWVAAIVAAIYTLKVGRIAGVALMCGLAMAAKIFGLLIVPFLLVRVPWKYRLLAVAVAVTMYLPFWLRGNAADLAGLRAMASEWEFNSTVYSALALAFQPAAVKGITLCTFAAIWLWLLIRWRREPATVLPRGDVVLGFFFLLSPVVNPWYLVALAPFVALRPSAWGVAALAIVPLSYVHGLNTNEPTLAPYEHPAWVRPTEVGLILLFAVVTWWRQRSSTRAERD